MEVNAIPVRLQTSVYTNLSFFLPLTIVQTFKEFIIF